MPYSPTVWNEGLAPGISAAKLTTIETQYAQAVADSYPYKLKPVTVRWVIPGWFAVATGSPIIVAGNLDYIPIWVEEATTYIRIGIRVTGAGAGGTLARLGIYEWSAGLPGALVLDAGTVAVDAAPANVEIIIAEALTRGYYFLAFVSDGTPTLQGLGVASAIKTPVAGLAVTAGATLDLVIPRVAGRAGDVAGGLADPAPAPTSTQSALLATVWLREV